MMIEYHFYKTWFFLNLFNLVSFNLHKLKFIKEIKDVFIKPQFKYIFTKNYSPFLYCSHHGKLFSIIVSDLQWKDKFDSPRHEENPFISIGLFNKYFFNWTWKLPPHLNNNCNDDYWEQAIWYLYYNNKDIKKARDTWPWKYMDDVSSWEDKFLNNKTLNEIRKG